ncbi:MAG: potassium-transporting ATPase subunit C [Planctomycetota bacterium]|nr:MAG: potassium-transporting ATPase subunit C [Planctomycetota bacterium]
MSTIRPTLVLFLLLTLVTGAIYPALVTGVAQVVFPDAANGSVVERNGRAVGSELIGQLFVSPAYFWSRPSATAPHAYNAASSSGSNLGPTNPALVDAVKRRIEALQADPNVEGPPPVDLVTASASGLDPHISPAAAEYQIRRVAAARGVSADAVRELVKAHIEPRTLGVLGEPRVNVLLLNLDLDRQFAAKRAAE